jgi:hypothetical protein
MTTWKPWPQDHRYMVCDDSTILGVRGEPLGHAILNQWGYLGMTLRRADGKRVGTTRHRIVCETFHGPCPPGKEVAHRDGDEANCRAENLEWKTKSENSADRIGHGTNGVKLTAEQVQEIRLARGTAAQVELAKQYGVTPLTIRHVWTGHTWKQLPWPANDLTA